MPSGERALEEHRRRSFFWKNRSSQIGLLGLQKNLAEEKGYPVVEVKAVQRRREDEGRAGFSRPWSRKRP
ncbi:UNVERIFIED_CONTAM: hypothetical protein K2H54_063905 [Gekko kuhli]